MAEQQRRLDAWGEALGGLPRPVRRDVLAGVVLLVVSHWWLAVLPSVLSEPPVVLLRTLPVVSAVLTVSGAACLVWVFASSDAGRAVGEHPVARWLGKRSFSLYLVHEPIVVAVAYALGGTADAALVLVLAVPMSLVAAEAFGRLVEAPALHLSRVVGRVLLTNDAARL